jgi:hypothetical protein
VCRREPLASYISNLKVTGVTAAKLPFDYIYKES